MHDRSENGSGAGRGRVWLCAAVFLLLLGGRRASAFSGDLSSDNVRIYASTRDDVRKWERFAAVCVGEVKREMGGVPGTDAQLSIHIDETPPPGDQDPLKIYVHRPQNLLQITFSIVKGLLGRYVMQPDSDTVPVVPSVGWMGAAIEHRLLFGNRQSRGFFEPDFEPARQLFDRGRFPDVKRLMAGGIPPSDPELFRLYALHCDILLLAVQSMPDGGKGMPLRLLQLEAFGRGSVEALSYLLAQDFQTGENLQAWYERVAVAVSRRGRRPSRATQVKKRLQELITVPVVAPGESTYTVTRVPIEEVPERLDAYRLDRQAILQLRADLFELLKDAPTLLQEPLGEYMTAFQSLAQGKIGRFKHQIKKAHKHFAENYKREVKLENYLDGIEAQILPINTRFGDYLDVIRRYERQERQLAPKLQKYLDSLSK